MCSNCGYAGDGQPKPAQNPAEQPVASTEHDTPPAAPPPPPSAAPAVPPASVPPAPTPAHPHPPMPEFAKKAFVHPPDSSAHRPDIYPDPTNAFAPQSDIAPQVDPSALPSNKRLGKKAILLSIIGLLLVGGVSYAAYDTLVASPKRALASYADKISNMQSGLFNGDITFSSANGGPINKVSLKLNGSFDIKDTKNEKIDLKLRGEAGVYKIGGEIMAIGLTAYGKVDPSPLLDSFGASELAGKWYKTSLEDSPVDDKCQNSYEKSLDKKFLAGFPVKNAKLVKLFDKVDGHSVRQYKGSVEVAKIPDYVEEANKKLPADCRINSFTKDDLKDVVGVDYFLWTGSDFDRLEIKVSLENPNSNGTLTFDTSKYNQSVSIAAPKDALDINGAAPELIAPPSDEPKAKTTPKSSPTSQPKPSSAMSVFQKMTAFVLGAR